MRSLCLIVVLIVLGSLALSPSAGAASTGSISGVVTGATSHQPLNIEVDLYDSSRTMVTQTCTGNDGSYSFSGLAAGTYYVGFVATRYGPCPPNGGLSDQYYNDESTLAAANPVTVTAGSTTNGIDAAMVGLPGDLTGTVIDAWTRVPIAGAAVSVYDSTGTVVGTTTTDATGAYNAGFFAPGSYRIGFTSPGYVSQFYNGEPSLAAADPVTIPEGVSLYGPPVSVIDAAMVPSTTANPISGAPTAVQQSQSPPQILQQSLPPVPAITRLSVTHKRFRSTGKAATLATTKVPRGTTVNFTVSAASTVRFTFQRAAPGRRVHGKCVASSRRNRHRRSCVRYVPIATLTYGVPAGPHSLYFYGRLSLTKKLGRGHYGLQLIAADLTGQSQPRRISFTIVK